MEGVDAGVGVGMGVGMYERASRASSTHTTLHPLFDNILGA